MKKIYVNSVRREEILGKYWPRIQRNNWVVVNAYQRIPGVVGWLSKSFNNGAIYAAGPRELYEAEWVAADAAEINFISNQEIIRRVIAECDYPEILPELSKEELKGHAKLQGYPIIWNYRNL